VLSDVGQPQLLRSVGGELAPKSALSVRDSKQVVMDGGPGSSLFLPRFLPNTDPHPSSEQVF
jgi:hypothetical protein